MTNQKAIPKDWEIKLIDDVCDNLDNKRIPISKEKREKGGTPYYGATGIVDYVSGYIFDENLLLIGEDGADWSKFANSAYLISGKSWVNNHAHVLRCKNINQIYLKEYLNYHDLNSYITGGTRGKLTKGILSNIPIIIPPKKEQEEIAKILFTLDDELKKINEIIFETERLKEGLSQRFFLKYSKRSKYKLGEILELVIDHRGLTPKKLGGEWITNGIPAISAMNVKNGKIVKTEEIRFVGEELYRKWMPKEITEGDVILTSEAPLGEVYFIKVGEKYCLSQRIFCLRTKKKIVSGKFLYYFLASCIGQKRLIDRATGSTAKGIRQTELMKVEISIPSLKDQDFITEILNVLDEKISINKKIKLELTKLKRGLMQDLLSGKVRVN